MSDGECSEDDEKSILGIAPWHGGTAQREQCIFPAAGKDWLTKQALTPAERISKGISLALFGKKQSGQVEQAEESKGGAAPSAPEAKAKMLSLPGEGKYAAFVDPTAPRAGFTDESGRRFFDNMIQPAMASLEGHFSWFIEWFPEYWPLENQDGDSSYGYVANLEDLHVTLELPKEPNRENVLIFADELGFCKRFMEKAPPRRVQTFRYVETRPADLSLEDMEAVLKEKKWDMVVYGYGIDRPASNSPKDIMKHLDNITRLYLELARLVLRNPTNCKRIACLTRDVFTTDARKHRQRGVGIVTSGCLWGMCNSMRIEMGEEEIPIQYIDFELKPNDFVLAQVASDMFCLETFGQNTVRVLDSGRYIMRFCSTKPYQVSDEKFEVPSDGIIAVTGGNGSLAQVFGSHLLDAAAQKNQENPEKEPCRFEIKMLSRSAVIRDREAPAWNEICEKAKALGIHVEQVKCDVSNPEAVDRFIQSCEGRLTGLIHTAGVLQDAMLRGQTWEKMQTTLGCKSRACLYLHDALERYSNPLQFFWVFSSNSIYGANGQVNYSGANHYLDGICRYRTAMGKPTYALQWGAWGEAGMAAAMADNMKMGILAGPQPFFSNVEGFFGMYSGIRTGIPAFAVQKYNPGVQCGMLANLPESYPHGASPGRYARNFHELMCPTQPPRTPPDIKQSDYYEIYRMHRSITNMYQKEQGLLWQVYATPVVAKQEKDDELW
mmetsp:Transcript_41053/g.87441  ORF Transcript_41053/g.87441 Transcript_41053/m.87441 type:complete len:720 (+) Transcript_41053:68-2227(+)